MTNLDFDGEMASGHTKVGDIVSAWKTSSEAQELSTRLLHETQDSRARDPETFRSRGAFFPVVSALLSRSFIKSYRDVVAYGIRFAM